VLTLVKNPFRLASFLSVSIASIVIVSPGSASRGDDVREFIYVQRLTHESVVIAWGSPREDASNTIGESSPPFGPAELDVFYRQSDEPIPGSPFLTRERNWIEVPLPRPSIDYRYELRVDGRPWGDAVYRRDGLLHFRSFPGPDVDSGSLTFLVLGDFGTGSKNQFRLAETMRRVVDQRERAGSPVRFVLTTGDNFYDFFLFFSTGSDDEQFYKKFFVPYQSLLTRIPFFPSLGNHDGSESESTEDLFHYRDNFFLPAAILPDGTLSRFEDRFYSVRFGKDVELLSLDTTRNRETRADVTWQPLYGGGEVSEQRLWLESQLARAKDVRWKIAYFHHPPFNAGRGHYGPRSKDRNLMELERELVPLLAAGGGAGCLQRTRAQLPNNAAGVRGLLEDDSLRRDRCGRQERGGTQKWLARNTTPRKSGGDQCRGQASLPSRPNRRRSHGDHAHNLRRKRRKTCALGDPHLRQSRFLGDRWMGRKR